MGQTGHCAKGTQIDFRSQESIQNTRVKSRNPQKKKTTNGAMLSFHMFQEYLKNSGAFSTYSHTLNLVIH